MHIGSVPERFAAFASADCTTVQLNGKNLAKVPDWIRTLTGVITLDLEGSQLTTLPIALADLLTGGLNLRLADNPLADPLSQLAKHGADTLAAYLRSLTDAKPHYEAKLLLVGEGNVGKSSLLAALLGRRVCLGTADDPRHRNLVADLPTSCS